jgi:hypothetical protein
MAARFAALCGKQRYLLVPAGWNAAAGRAGRRGMPVQGLFFKKGENHFRPLANVGHWPVANLEPGMMEPLIDTGRGSRMTRRQYHGYAQLTL